MLDDVQRINQYEELGIMPLDRLGLPNDTVHGKNNYEGWLAQAATTLDRDGAKRAKGTRTGETRAFSADSREDRIRAQARAVVSVGGRG